MALFCLGQQSKTRSSIASFEEILQSYGIQLTNDSLIDALQSPVPRVRATAALELAEKNARGASTSIGAALDREK
ncbi:MAG: hypothetical protein ACRD3E_06675, partial [Terriglobales bacterium]